VAWQPSGLRGHASATRHQRCRDRSAGGCADWRTADVPVLARGQKGGPLPGAVRQRAAPALPPAGVCRHSTDGISWAMAWDVEYTDELRAWWDTLTESQQDDVAAVVQLLMDEGPHLRFPHSSGVEGSTHRHMRELRVQSGGRPLRIFYALIRGARRSCSWGGTRPETIGFMIPLFPERIGSMRRM